MKLIKTSKLISQVAQIGISLIALLSTSLFIGQTSQAKPIGSESQLIVQSYPQWQRYRLNYISSVNFPARSRYANKGLSANYRGVYYFATSDRLHAKTREMCGYLNCKTVMGILVKKTADRYNLSVRTMKPLTVNTRSYPADGIEFTATSNYDGRKLKGRMYIIGNYFYLLTVATNKNYFDAESNIFLQSLSF